jgi:hypothetical protein
MTAANEKSIELRGGPLDGHCATVPMEATQASFQVDSSDKFSAWVVYRPTPDQAGSGAERWVEYVESQWGDTGLADL